jgi:hypothetical protein
VKDGEIDIWRRVYAIVFLDTDDASVAVTAANKAVEDLRNVNTKLGKSKKPGLYYMSQVAVGDYERFKQ